MSRNFVVVLAGLGALMSLQSAIACSCVVIDPAVAYPNEGTVVLVKVTGLDKSPVGSPWNVTLAILRSWKGAWRPEMTFQVETPGPSGPCGFFIHVGDEFLVYSDDPATLMHVTMCNTVRGEQVSKHIQMLDALSSRSSQSDPNKRWKGP
jgi:hypothetical protein